MQRIHVKRFDGSEAEDCQGYIEPEDGSWMVMIDSSGKPALLERCSYEEDDGTVTHGYVDVVDIALHTTEQPPAGP